MGAHLEVSTSPDVSASDASSSSLSSHRGDIRKEREAIGTPGRWIRSYRRFRISGVFFCDGKLEIKRCWR